MNRARQRHITLAVIGNELSAVGQHKMHRLEVFVYEIYRDLKTRVRGHSRSWQHSIDRLWLPSETVKEASVTARQQYAIMSVCCCRI